MIPGLAYERDQQPGRDALRCILIVSGSIAVIIGLVILWLATDIHPWT